MVLHLGMGEILPPPRLIRPKQLRFYLSHVFGFQEKFHLNRKFKREVRKRLRERDLKSTDLDHVESKSTSNHKDRQIKLWEQ